MRLDCFTQEHMNSSTSTKPQESCWAVLESHQELPILIPSTAFTPYCVLNRNPLFKQTLPIGSAINEESASLAAVSVLQEYPFSQNWTPQQGGRPAGPLWWQWNGLWESQGSLTPGNEGPQAHPWLPSLVCFCQTQVLALEMFRWWIVQSAEWGGWGSFPGLGWHGRLKTRLQKALGSIWLQICKSPQAVNELIPNLVQNKEKQLLPRVLQLLSNQDFNAQTRKAQRRRGCQGLLCPLCVLDMEEGLEKFWRMLPWAAAQNPAGAASARSCHVPWASELLWHLQPEGMGQDQVWQIHPELWHFSGCTGLHISLGNCSTGITQWCCSRLLGSGVIKIFN